MITDTVALARRFPLVARSRPPCAPLDARVGELCRLADSAARSTDPTAASAVYNQAALLASDAGLPELARTWCHRHAILLFCGKRVADRDVHTMLGLYQALECPGRTAVFHTRLGLTVVDALGGTDHPRGGRIATDLIRRAIEERDGYRAREILTHPSGAVQPVRDELAEVTASCGLGTGRLPEALHALLTEAVATSEATLTRTLRMGIGQARGGSRSGR